MIKFKHPDLIGSDPKKKIKKKPTGILKDLTRLNKYLTIDGITIADDVKNSVVRWSDVETIIKKYS